MKFGELSPWANYWTRRSEVSGGREGLQIHAAFLRVPRSLRPFASAVRSIGQVAALTERAHP
jgi:hypothetical protein